MKIDRYFLILVGVVGAIASSPFPVAAQLQPIADTAPDRSLGTTVEPLNAQTDLIRKGVRSANGVNLFHSFQEFNIAQGRGAYFIVPDANVVNILARVTGGNPSQILGTLGSRQQSPDGTFASTAANLFLMNPNGIVFGENARLDVGGSFAATTANGVEFGDRGSFSATSPEVPSVLTINPSAFLFTQITAQPIVNQSRAMTPNAPTLMDGLRVRDGMSLLLLGGDIVFDGGVAQAGGLIELGALRGMGQMYLTVNGKTLDVNIPNGTPLADITLTNGAIVSASGVVGVAIQAHSANLTIANGSTIGSIVFGDEDGKTLKFQVGKLNLITGGRISAFTFGSGKSSDIEINAETIELIGLSNDRQSVSAIESESRSAGAGGKAGDVVIRAQRLAVKDGAFISTQTLGQGQGGNLTVTAREAIILSGTGTRADGRVFKSGLFSTTSGAGGANNLRVLETGQLTIREGALINASTFGTGQGGNVEINADTIELIGLSNDRQSVSAIGSESVSTGTGGKAGDVVIRAQRLAIKDGARISTQTFGQGQGGNLTVTVRKAITLSGTATLVNGQVVRSGLSSITTGAGAAGNLRVLETEQLTVRDGAQINTSTFGSGQSGNVEINADAIELIGFSNDRQVLSAIVSGSVSPGAGGKAGDMMVRTQRLAVKDGAIISTQTFGQGQGGNLTVIAREAMTLSGTATLGNGQAFSSGLFSTTAGAGGAGNLRVLETGQLTIRAGARINASTRGTGQGGNVEINANAIELVGLSNDRQFASFIASTSVSTGAGGKAGDMVLTTQRLAVKDGAFVSTQTFGQGQGGNLTVTAREAMTLSGTGTLPDGQAVPSDLLSTTAGGGEAGNLQIYTGSLNIQDGARISASATGLGRASSINVKVDDTLKMENGSISSASLFSEGSDLTVTAGKIRLQGNSDITTNVFSGVGSGGNITLTANSIVALNDSDILAFAKEGAGGNVTLNTRAFFGQNYRPAPFSTDPRTLDGNDRVDINASGTLANGTIITPNTSFIQNSLSQLPTSGIDTNKLLSQTCIIRKDQPQGTFHITGIDNIPNRPNDPPPSPHPPPPPKTWKLGDPIAEPQGFYKLTDGRLVMGRECDR